MLTLLCILVYLDAPGWLWVIFCINLSCKAILLAKRRKATL